MLERYLSYVGAIKNLSSHSIRAYRKDIESFLDFLERRGIALKEVSFHDVRRYVSELSKRELSSRSINRKISSIKGFFKFLRKEGYIESNPMDVIGSLKTENALPTFLFEDEMDEFLDIETKDFWSLRDRAIFEFLYSTGCRVSELTSLNLKDVDLKNGTVRVVGKGRKERIVYLGREGREVLRQYLLKRKYYVKSDSPDGMNALFINQQGKRLTDRGVRYVLAKYISQSNVLKRVTPHTFRHSFATHILNRGADIRIVQELLGHSSPSTTQIYTHIGLDKLKRIYLNAHPHARIRDAKNRKGR